jgi:hypothetical protein
MSARSGRIIRCLPLEPIDFERETVTQNLCVDFLVVTKKHYLLPWFESQSAPQQDQDSQPRPSLAGRNTGAGQANVPSSIIGVKPSGIRRPS